MTTRALAIGFVLLSAGLSVGAGFPLKAQSSPDPCMAPWDVAESSSSAGNGGWHAVKWNRCTGEAHVLVFPGLKPEAEYAMWQKLPVK